jgi:hypothetical protein
MEGQPIDIIKELVLRAISDDYERFERVLDYVTTWAIERGTAANLNRVIDALRALIGEGYAQAYSLSASPRAEAEAVAFSEGFLNDQWFYVTLAGKDLARSLQSRWVTRVG